MLTPGATFPKGDRIVTAEVMGAAGGRGVQFVLRSLGDHHPRNYALNVIQSCDFPNYPFFSFFLALESKRNVRFLVERFTIERLTSTDLFSAFVISPNVTYLYTYRYLFPICS